jgi:hypothetical protein
LGVGIIAEKLPGKLAQTLPVTGQIKPRNPQSTIPESTANFRAKPIRFMEFDS